MLAHLCDKTRQTEAEGLMPKSRERETVNKRGVGVESGQQEEEELVIHDDGLDTPKPAGRSRFHPPNLASLSAAPRRAHDSHPPPSHHAGHLRGKAKEAEAEGLMLK